ncbi:uncharacterized protein LOC132745678 [Ruditapes philippinarum]|uniref:uncharacterized protein LOC132745678 n=1 Tax=Ruditapes philippinarum TaxID=129788 RepID=UPI00295BE1BC|nr:uncharacterized protein LOC132745678 [Ruditapes philippinarum]
MIMNSRHVESTISCSETSGYCQTQYSYLIATNLPGFYQCNSGQKSGQKCSCVSRRRNIVWLIFLIGVIYYVIYLIGSTKQYLYKVDTYSLPCEMPILDPYDADQMKNVKLSEPFICDNTPFLVYIDKENLLQFNTSAVNILQIARDSIMCTCEIIKRGVDTDDEVTYSDTFDCTPPYNIPSDFFKITCSSAENELLNTMLTKIHRRRNDLKSNSDGFFSVILFGLDSVSRNNAIRQIPRAVKYLHENLSSIDLLMYNRIGGHTFDNIVPMLTGLLANTDDIPYLNDVGTRFEKLPFIWKNFSENNYVTFYAEDHLQFHTFNFKKEGFKRQPTDHYVRPFWIADFESRPTKLLFWKEDMSSYNKRKCLANIPKYLVQINYLKQFIDTYKDVRKFGISHLNELSHQDVNDLHLAEDDLIEFFRWFKEGDHLDDTFLIVYSDHGPRGQSQTHQSLLETNLPFLSIVPPNKFRSSFPEIIENMKRNAHVLTTHFDLFATLKDILLRQFKEPSITFVHNKPRGISLFRDIQKQRSCSESSIPDQFCMCYRSQKLNITNNSVIKQIAQDVADKLNQALAGAKGCARLHVAAVLEAHVLVQGKQTVEKRQGLFNKISNVVSGRDYADYRIVIQTHPGNAKFFATSKIAADGKRYVLDNIERINRYNNQSYCVSDDKLRPLCYCVE